MSRKSGIRGVSLPLSAVLDWCKRATDRYRRFAGRIAGQSQMVRRENQSDITRATNVSNPLHVDLAGKSVELRELTKALRIGDRVRVFCDDGILVAEKISETQFELIQAEPIAQLVH
jgi:hypothetical protein